MNAIINREIDQQCFSNPTSDFDQDQRDADRIKWMINDILWVAICDNVLVMCNLYDEMTSQNTLSTNGGKW